ncbi:MAG: hypothetical protein ACKPKO_36680 [Candidatus Fonsibacter sp.]
MVRQSSNESVWTQTCLHHLVIIITKIQSTILIMGKKLFKEILNILLYIYE